MPFFVLLWYFLLYIPWSKKDTKRGRKRKIADSEENAFVTPIFSGFLNARQDTFHKLYKFWEISPKQIIENQKQGQIITGGHLSSWSLS